MGCLTAFIVLLSILFGWWQAHAELPPVRERPVLIAHRGVHQIFPHEGIENDTCTATRIYPPTHRYFENTLSSMEAAFALGADMVELDIHPTTDGKLAVFHDWTIDCRTDGRGVTHEQTMPFLKTLDIGYGYTADDGKTFPLRGMGVGAMPELQEVIDAFPDKKLGINFKDNFERTAVLLADALEPLSVEQRANFSIFGSNEQFERVRARIPQVNKIQPSRGELIGCAPEILTMLVTASLSEKCRVHGIAIPAQYLSVVPGWPNFFLHQAHAAGVPITIAEVETLETFEQIKDLPIAVIETNTIEIIGPAFEKHWEKMP